MLKLSMRWIESAQYAEDRLKQVGGAIFSTQIANRFRLQAPFNRKTHLQDFIEECGVIDTTLETDGMFVYKIAYEETMLSGILLSILVNQRLKQQPPWMHGEA